MKKLLLTLFAFLIAIDVAYPQLAIRHRLATPKPADSLDIDYYSHKRGLQAGTMVFGINMGVWAFDRYIRKADFAYINGRTIKDNLKHGFVWDNDAMGTNMFMHPYHGSLYFNSARSNGYNFWQSGLFAFGGSFMWEMFMENEYPSTNDIIATPIGGMALGEVTYSFRPHPRRPENRLVTLWTRVCRVPSVPHARLDPYYQRRCLEATFHFGQTIRGT